MAKKTSVKSKIKNFFNEPVIDRPHKRQRLKHKGKLPPNKTLSKRKKKKKK